MKMATRLSGMQPLAEGLETVSLEWDPPTGVALLTLRRPGTLNALNAQLVEEARKVCLVVPLPQPQNYVTQASGPPAGIVHSGGKPVNQGIGPHWEGRGFCSGADLSTGPLARAGGPGKGNQVTPPAAAKPGVLKLTPGMKVFPCPCKGPARAAGTNIGMPWS